MIRQKSIWSNFSIQNPQRKQKQAQIYAETGRITEAYKAYEHMEFKEVGEELITEMTLR